MRDPIYYIRRLPNGRHTAELSDGRGGLLSFEHMTDEQARLLADELTRFATWITQHVDDPESGRAEA